MAKAKKAFFTPARNPGWYRGVQNGDAAKLVGEGTGNGKPLYHLSGPVRSGLGQVLSASGNYELIHRVSAASQGARQDLARVVVAHMLAKPGRTDALMTRMSDAMGDLAETLWDRAEMRADVETPLTVESPALDNAASEAEAELASTMLKADKARERLFAEGLEKNWQGTDLQPEIYYLDRLKPAAEALSSFAASMRSGGKPGPVGDALIETLSTKLSPDTLVRLADELPVHYGGPDNWMDGPTRAESEARLNAIDLTMRHWDEVSGGDRFPGGISIGNGRVRAVPAAVVEAQGVRVNDQADFDAVTSKPKAATAPDATARRPGGR
ncbi:MAG: hypothetical protein KI792_13420 [Alphaproteobacteria bacterium]|nr:hypothetical protein [Alphaproteobacteria bacterium SS10]